MSSSSSTGKGGSILTTIPAARSASRFSPLGEAMPKQSRLPEVLATKIPAPAVAAGLENSGPAGMGQTKKETWQVLAMEIIDSMAMTGGVQEGLAACEQLVRVQEDLPAEAYWKAAILSSLAGRSEAEVAKWVAVAETKAATFRAHLLPGGSVRAYVQRLSGKSLDETLNRHAMAALQSEQPADSYRILAGLLKLDGQHQRANRFVTAFEPAMKEQSRDHEQPPRLAVSPMKAAGENGVDSGGVAKLLQEANTARLFVCHGPRRR